MHVNIITCYVTPSCVACYVFFFGLQMLYMKYGGNKLLNLLETWYRPFPTIILVGGILYYITAPQRGCIYYVETMVATIFCD